MTTALLINFEKCIQMVDFTKMYKMCRNLKKL